MKSIILLIALLLALVTCPPIRDANPGSAKKDGTTTDTTDTSTDGTVSDGTGSTGEEVVVDDTTTDTNRRKGNGKNTY